MGMFGAMRTGARSLWPGAAGFSLALPLIEGFFRRQHIQRANSLFTRALSRPLRRNFHGNVYTILALFPLTIDEEGAKWATMQHRSATPLGLLPVLAADIFAVVKKVIVALRANASINARPRSVLLNIVSLITIVVALSALHQSLAAEQSSDVPAWLKVHIGDGEGQIAHVVLQRARALYLQKVSEGAVKNSCYFAMDATRPNDLSDSKLGRRFYEICESARSFRAISAGHGAGRNLEGGVDFKNGRRCAKNFSNAMDSKLTAGGAYVTGETKKSFKGYYRVSAKHYAVLMRSFVQFVGEDETANARQREIGGHAAVLLRKVCLLKDPQSPHANNDGYVRFGKLADYAGGRSDGCTSWSRSDSQKIIAMVKDDPTTLYIYPAAADVNAVAQAVKAGHSLVPSGLYWNRSCLKEIGSPKFWPKEILEPILAKYKKDHPAPPERPTPICKGRYSLR
jgi:hypothetical protein